MCTPTELAGRARQKLRDFGHYFEVPYAATPPSRTLRLPHPLVDAASFIMWTPEGEVVLPTSYSLDQRNGIVKLAEPAQFPDGLGCSGYYYEWFLTEDLLYHASVLTNQHLYDRTGTDASGFNALECDVVATGSVVHALWSLLSEFAVDIDVSTPEGMTIPVSQRFHQVMELANFWGAQYTNEAAMLNVGLNKLEQYTLRRVARLTNRLVPLMREREVDDHRPPERLLPAIPDGIQDDGESVFMPEPPGSIGYGSWGSVGTSGDSPAGSS